MTKKIVVLVTLLMAQLVFAQTDNSEQKSNKIAKINSRKGSFFASWGWNRDSYGKSDITFTGDNYNFTLNDVKADDKPNPFGIKFISPAHLTLPQTNYRLGYFIKDNYNVILGVDHMKYVMRPNQEVSIDGNIHVGNANYDGDYNGETIQLSKDFLMFEHTDGLNYIFVGINRFDNFNKFLGIRTDKFEINLEEGVDFGVHMPRSNTTLLEKERYDEFHLAGFGFSMKAGLNLTFFKHFYLQSDFKYGYVSMPDIRTTNSKNDRAKQNFSFFESIYSFGYRFRIK